MSLYSKIQNPNMTSIMISYPLGWGQITQDHHNVCDTHPSQLFKPINLRSLIHLILSMDDFYYFCIFLQKIIKD